MSNHVRLLEGCGIVGHDRIFFLLRLDQPEHTLTPYIMSYCGNLSDSGRWKTSPLRTLPVSKKISQTTVFLSLTVSELLLQLLDSVIGICIHYAFTRENT